MWLGCTIAGVHFVMNDEDGGLLCTVLGLVCIVSFVVILGKAVIRPASSITEALKYACWKLPLGLSEPFRRSAEWTGKSN